MEKQKRNKKQGGMAEIWRRFRKSKLAMFGLILIVVIILLSCCASLICDYEKDAITQNAMNRFADPSFPRVSGGDPIRDVKRVAEMRFSPRKRG